MSLMSYNQLVDLVELGAISNLENSGQINASSIDVRLGALVFVETKECDGQYVDPLCRTNFPHKVVDLTKGSYFFKPGEFGLASTLEVFSLPNDITAEFRLKSSGARSGLNNLFACHCDPGWNGSVLTLELHNVMQHTAIKLTYGMPIGQMLFHHHVVPVPGDQSYAKRGRYNGDLLTQAVKP